MSRARAALAATLLFAAATPWVLRPWFVARDALPRAAGPMSGMFDADLYLNVWILGWMAHAMLTDPTHLFDGNIYYPARNTIAGSENMLAHLPVTVPALAATGNVLVALKAMALESFVLAGLAMFLLVHHHTRDAGAALLAGAAYTFAPWRVHALPQPQYLGTQYLPLALLAVDCWLERRRVRALAGLAAALALQALACLYLGYFAFVTVPVYALARLVRTPGRVRAAAGLAAGFAAAALVALPVALPYLHARAQNLIPAQAIGNLAVFGQQPATYLRPAILAGFLGVVPVAVLLCGLAARLVRAGTERLPMPGGATWVLLAAGVLFSAGPYLALPGGHALPLPYLALYRLVPGFASLRAPSRFFIVVTVALSALAGYELARLTAGRSHRLRLAAGPLLALACVVSGAPHPTPVLAAHLGADAPPVYRWVARQPPDGPVLEIPAWQVEGDLPGQLASGRYMVASTLHWHPLLNGYTAYPPPTAEFLAAAIRRLPDPEALAVLVDSVDVRWIVVHGAPWPETPGLAPAARFDNDQVYAVSRAPAHPWRAELLARARAPAADTLEGTPTAPLAPECRAGRLLEVTPPATMLPVPAPVPVRVRFANASPCRWPALGVRRDGLVGLTYAWTAPSGRIFPDGAFTRLLHDVAPGETVDTTMLVFPGGEPGTWRLEARLVQEGVTEALARQGATVELKLFSSTR
ncbi:MAG TPA: hypothetical protein VMR79_02865 [Verrucomicrobiae bacterium]|nr:hypothetical protein [Verrucomicrobiae bacterium]